MNEAKTKIDPDRSENIISGQIVDTALYIHRELGPGLLESAYENALIYCLRNKGFKIDHQKPIPVKIDGHDIGTGFRADLIVNDTVICEIKSLEKTLPVHTAQLMTYLRLSGIKIGLLMNFGCPLFKDGLKRIII